MKTRPVFFSLILLAATVLSDTPGFGMSRMFDANWAWTASVNSDLIVSGTITAIDERDTYCGNQIRGHAQWTVLTIDVDNVLKGTAGDTIEAVQFGGSRMSVAGIPLDYRLGEEVLLCMRYDPELFSGAYRLFGLEDSMVKRDKKWITRSGLAEGNLLGEISSNLRELDPRHMAKTASVVAIGTVESVDSCNATSGGSVLGRANCVTVRISTAWKGADMGERLVVFNMLLPYVRFAPVVGESYLVFLDHYDVGFWSIRGFNSFIHIDDAHLVARDGTRYPIPLERMCTILEYATGNRTARYVPVLTSKSLDR